MSWDVFGGDDQMFEDDFTLYKQYKARERARWGGGSSGGSEDTDGGEWTIGPSFGGGHYAGKASGGLTPAAKPQKAEPADPKADALFRLDLAKQLVEARNRARVKLIIYCLVTSAIGLWALIATDCDVGGVFWALLMLACNIGMIWAYNKQHGGADELYDRCLKQYNELKAKENGADTETKAAEEN